jgi:hypothetical protein
MCGYCGSGEDMEEKSELLRTVLDRLEGIGDDLKVLTLKVLASRIGELCSLARCIRQISRVQEVMAVSERVAGVQPFFPVVPSAGLGKSSGITILRGLFTPKIALEAPQRAYIGPG